MNSGGKKRHADRRSLLGVPVPRFTVGQRVEHAWSGQRGVYELDLGYEGETHLSNVSWDGDSIQTTVATVALRAEAEPAGEPVDLSEPL
ncbi:hypothetical protein [Antribacter gilvus]|uniref:hypothetical protein n=1 Tax=Antribacter gilvus TaxID=2304675 RepID=UPI000F78BD24|nr:hypothetical protein [Antribacter gilvus]